MIEISFSNIFSHILRNESDNYICKYKSSRFIKCKGNNYNNYCSKKISSWHNNICYANINDNSFSYGNKDCSHFIFGISNAKGNGNTYPNHKAGSSTSFNNICSAE